jgi:hypothetical protein
MHNIITYIRGRIINTIPPFFTTAVAPDFGAAAIFSSTIFIKVLHDTGHSLIACYKGSNAHKISGFGILYCVIHHIRTTILSDANDLASVSILPDNNHPDFSMAACS